MYWTFKNDFKVQIHRPHCQRAKTSSQWPDGLQFIMMSPQSDLLHHGLHQNPWNREELITNNKVPTFVKVFTSYITTWIQDISYRYVTILIPGHFSQLQIKSYSFRDSQGINAHPHQFCLYHFPQLISSQGSSCRGAVVNKSNQEP